MTDDREILSRRWKQAESVVSRHIAGELVLVPIKWEPDQMRCFFSLNPVGGRIWDLLDGQRPLTEILDVLLGEYDVSAGQAEAEVLELVGQLEKSHLIVPA
jgi:hypothetical protein